MEKTYKSRIHPDRKQRILILSRHDAEAYFRQSLHSMSAVISITDFGDTDADIEMTNNNNLKDILRLQFNDVDPNGLCDDNHAMTMTQAKDIAKFVYMHLNDVDIIVVHCGAGVSRSAGCAAAILKYLTGDDNAVFSDLRYIPNMFVYRHILEALYELDD